MSGHPHADLMAKAAEIAKTDKAWYRHFEFKARTMSSWADLVWIIGFDENVEYRLKPRTIDINGHQVPEPVRDPLEVSNLLWIADITQLNAEQLMWTGHASDILMLERGILHLTKEAAEAHMTALLSFTQK